MSASTPAPTLAGLQRQFRNYVLRESRTPPAEVSALGAGVYAEAFVLRHADALRADYPALRTLLGDSDFATLAESYVLAHPSRDPSIRWVGRHLPKFLETTPPYGGERYLGELARFEWALSEAFDSAALPPLGIDALRAIPPRQWAGLTLGFHPSLRRVDLEFDVVAVWRQLTDAGYCADLPKRGPLRRWSVWRPELEVRYRQLDDGEHVALDALREGATFATAATRLSERENLPAGAVPARLSAWLAGWVRQGLVTSLHTTGDGDAIAEGSDR